MGALYLIGFLSSLGFSIVVPFLVFLVTGYGGNGFVLGAIGAGYWGAQLLGAPWLGALSDRFGRKRVLLRSQLGAVGAWLIFLAALTAPRVELARIDTVVTGAFTLTLPLLLIAVSRATDGLFNGSISVANAYVSDVNRDDDRRVAFARLGAATNLGFVVGPVFAGLLAHRPGGAFVVVGLALALSSTAAVLVRFRVAEVSPRATTPAEVDHAACVDVHKLLGGGCRDEAPTPRRGVRDVLAVPALRPLIALYFLVFLAFSIFTATFPIHAAVGAGWSSERLGALFTVLSLALVATQTALLPRLSRWTSAPVLGLAGCAVLVAAYVLLSHRTDVALFAGAILYGVGNGIMWPSYLSLLSGAAPPQLQGTVQGVGSGAGSLASIVGTLTGGTLFELIGGATLYVSASVVGIAGLLFGGGTRARNGR